MDLSPYLDLFVAEAREHLAAAYALAAGADRDDAAQAALRDVFRHVHSVKGMAASMGFAAMSSLAHDAESLMDRLRAGPAPAPPATRRLLCDTLACLERMVERAGRRDAIEDGERPVLQARLRHLLAGGAPEGTAVAGGGLRPHAAEEGARPCFSVAVIVRRDRTFPAIRAALVLGRMAKLGRIVRTDPPMAALRTGRFDGRLFVTIVSEHPARELAGKIAGIDEIETFTLVPAEAPETTPAPEAPILSVRVGADRIEALIEDTLELMSTLGRIEARLALPPGSPGTRDGESARRLARRAYDALVDMRLVPFDLAAQRLQRAADEVAGRVGKPVTLTVEGRDVRIDRGLLERLMDPLLHLLRNAIDHGIETPPARRTARKPAAGRMAVTLLRQASGLVLAVEDDGAGLDARRLKQVAIERGMLSPSEAMRLDEASAWQLITAPGFSTVERTTEVSGRGVGMDIVKATVESLGGHLRIASRVGRGTRFELMLPSSVALVQAYLVRSSGGIFAVPLTSIARIAPMDDGSTVWRDGRRYWSAGSDHVPVASLCDLLATSAGSAPGGGIALLAESAEGGLAGTEVDEILGRREIIVRPLPPPLCGLAGYTGAAVLDDGSIVLVLDLGRLPRS